MNNPALSPKSDTQGAEPSGNAPATVWVVMGESGEYSDRSVWVESVWTTEAAAQTEVERLQLLSRQAQIASWERDKVTYPNWKRKDPSTLPLTHTDPGYWVDAVPLDAPGKPQ